MRVGKLNSIAYLPLNVITHFQGEQHRISTRFISSFNRIISTARDSSHHAQPLFTAPSPLRLHWMLLILRRCAFLAAAPCGRHVDGRRQRSPKFPKRCEVTPGMMSASASSAVSSMRLLRRCQIFIFDRQQELFRFRSRWVLAADVSSDIFGLSARLLRAHTVIASHDDVTP